MSNDAVFQGEDVWALPFLNSAVIPEAGKEGLALLGAAPGTLTKHLPENI